MRTSRKNKIFAAAYAVLVGVPVLCSVAIVERNQDLVAPRSVAGVWTLQFIEQQTLPCPHLLPPGGHISLEILQSGKYLSVSLNCGLSSGSGVMDANKLIATMSSPVQPAAGGQCPKDCSLLLVGYFESSRIPKKMTGTLLLQGCQSCAPVEFVAVRQTSEEANGNPS